MQIRKASGPRKSAEPESKYVQNMCKIVQVCKSLQVMEL
jgi:hypothetical protein